MTTHGEFNWIELQTHNANQAIAFYQETIGWEFRAEKMPTGGTYWIGLSSGKPVCGVLTLDNNKGNSEPDRWITYVHIDDLDDAISRMQACGGELIRAPWEVPGVGRVAMIRDPGGAEMGWVTPVQQVEK